MAKISMCSGLSGVAVDFLDASRSVERLHYGLYKVSAFVLLNFVDDPVWLALLFC